MNTRKRNQRGSSLVEFTLVGIPAIFLLIGTVELARGMWNYFTLARAVDAGARLASIRGSDCSASGNTCGVSIGTLATTIANAAIGIPSGSLNVTFTSDSGGVTPCNPLSSCLNSTTTWPPSSNNDNQPGKKVKVTATYSFSTVIAMFWPGHGAFQTTSVTFPASSTQPILF